MSRPKRSRAAASKPQQSGGQDDGYGDGDGGKAGGSPDESYHDNDDSSEGFKSSDGGDGSELGTASVPAAASSSTRKARVVNRRGRGRRAVLADESDQDEQGETLPPTDIPPAPPDVYQIPPYPQDSRRTRLYVGPLKKWDRYRSLVEILYGPDVGSIAIIDGLRQHWLAYPVLPRRGGRAGEPGGSDGSDNDDDSGGMQPTPWVSDTFESDQAATYRRWHGTLWDADGKRLQLSAPMNADDGRQCMPPSAGDLVALLGPGAGQQAVRFQSGSCVGVGADGLPWVEAGEREDGTEQIDRAGWLLDVGGLVTAVAWAPLSGRVEQLLAVATVPHRDQEVPGPGEPEAPANDEQSLGSVQLWRVALDRGRRDGPRLERVLLFDWGRPKRMQWCPVPLTGDEAGGVYGVLAVLTSDGSVRVVEVSRGGEVTEYEWIHRPLATLTLDEYKVVATALAWAGINRLVVGYSDGSLALWSVHPRQLLVRLPLHATHVLDVCTGYPSYPHMVASRPVGGLARLVDLTQPSNQHTLHTAPMVALVPGLLQWSDHMLGFASAAPSNNPRSGSLDFLHVRFFPGSRSIMPAGRHLAAAVCLSVGAAHPFVLVGRADGSLWAANMLQKVLHNRADVSWRLKVYESEYRSQAADPADPTAVRGAVRFFQGFDPEPNERLSTAAAAAAAAQQHTRAPAPADEASGPSDNEDDAGSDAEQESAQTVIHDPRTRISAVAWNPNVEYGWWAAVGMASGLVRIMDLGVA